MSSLTVAILCGGAGVRLWPASRDLYPKQFLALTGERTLLQETVRRAVRISQRPPILVCNEEQRFIVAEQLRAIGVEAQIVLEPARRDSGPAIAVAAELCRREEEDGLLLVLPSDHFLPETAAFAAAVGEAAPAAEAGFIVTFGIAPNRPATEYGYILPGEAVGHGKLAKVARFIEKPDAALAAHHIAEGSMWNSGMFLFRARDLLADLAGFEPDMALAAREAVDGIAPFHGFIRLGRDAFLSSPAKSIDYAVMERTARAAVLPVSFAWSDVGNWAALWEIAPRDEMGNACIGPVRTLATSRSYIRSDRPLTAAVGLDGIIVVACGDAVLVAAREAAQQVKELVAALEQEGRAEVAAQTGLFRPWGMQQTLQNGPGFAVRRLVIRPGGTISRQRHRHRAEHWVVVRGRIAVTLGDGTRHVGEGESVFVPAGQWHRIDNPGPEPAEVIEVQTGDPLGEADVERAEA